MSWWGSRIDLVSPLQAAGADQTLGQIFGPCAELATLKSRALAHEARAELELAANCWTELARCCSFKKTRHDAAIQHARRALSLREVPVLRDELAQWLEGIGAWADAAKLTSESGEPTSPADRARWHRRLASLWWRAGSLDQAAQSLAEIARLDAECTEPLELLAGLHTNAPEVVSRERAVLAQLEAARRYQQRGARLSAFEAELRAFEIDPSSILATEQLAISLGKLGRREAAEDIWRICAKLTSDPSLLHLQIDKAVSRNEFDRALGAGLDALSDATLSVASAAQATDFSLQPFGATPKTFDALLARARLFGWLAARLEIALIEARASDQTRSWILLTRFYASAMGRPELAVNSLERALVTDATSSDIRRMLEAFATEDDDSNRLTTALVDAVRAGVSPEIRLRLASEFIDLQCKEKAPSSLVVWALEALGQDTIPALQRTSIIDWRERRTAEREEWQNSLNASKQLQAEPRVRVLRPVAAAMALDPDSLAAERDVVLSWLDDEPESPVALGRLARLVDVLSWQMPVESTLEIWERVFGLLCSSSGDSGVLAVASFWLRQGRIEDALLVLRHAMARPEPSQRLLGWVVTLARRVGDQRLFADGLTLLAKTTETQVAAVLLAQAAEAYLELNDTDAARRTVDSGLGLAPTSARLVSADVRLHEVKDSLALAETLEHALGIIPPRAQFAFQLAQAHQKLGNAELALAWAQRASTLQPAAAPLRALVAQMAIAANDSSRMAEWLIRSIDIPAPVNTWLPTAVIVLHALIQVDAPRAAEVVRRLVNTTGVSDPNWRATMLLAADAVSDARLALDVLERAIAAGRDLPDTLQEVVRRRLQLGDFESAYEGALRAMKLGVPGDTVRTWVPTLFEHESYQVADTELAAAELSWQLAQQGTDAEAALLAMRRLARDRLVLARDEPEAVAIWSRLFNLGIADVVAVVTNDMVPSLGHAATIRHLQTWCEADADPKRKAAFCVASAYLHAQMDDGAQARSYVAQALSYDPANTQALIIAESQAHDATECQWLDEMYAIAAGATLGNHGDRAVHYRAAKVFETRGEYSRALKHACAAFVAMPSEGLVLRLAASLSRRASDAEPFVQAVWTVAGRCRSQSRGAHWVSLAIDELEKTEDFLPARFDLLLAALSIEPSVSIVQKTSDALQRFLQTSPSDGEMASLRFAKALRARLDDAKGPHGARLALATAAASECLLDFELCAHSLRCSFRCDAAIDEFSEAEPTLAWFSTSHEVASRLLNEVLTDLDQPYINVGFPAIKTLGFLQLGAGDDSSLQRLNDLVARLGQREEFLEWMETALERSPQGADGFAPVLQQLVQVRLQENQPDDAVQLLVSIIANNPRTPLAYESAQQCVALMIQHRDLNAAKHWVLTIRESLTPIQSATLELDLARKADDPLELVQALSHRAYSDPNSPAEGMTYLQEATALADRLGYAKTALDCAKSAVAWDPNHVDAQLQLAVLLYKSRDREGDDHPEEVVAALRKLPAQNRPDDEELRAFLLAEALDAAQGTGAGTDELVRAHAKFGPLPLLALGLAERLVLAGDGGGALPLLQYAIEGDLKGLRSLANVCVEAARVARSLGQSELALQWLRKAMTEDNCPAAASALATDIENESRATPSIESSHGTSDSDPTEQDEVLSLPGLTEQGARQPSPEPSRIEGASDEDSLEIPLVRRRADGPPSSHPDDKVPAAVSATSDQEPESLDDAVAQARFMVELASPSYQTLTLLRRWLRRWPGSAKLMEYVRDAAFVERDIPLSRAVEHARGVMLGLSERVEPPELSAQPIVPEAVRALLAKDLSTPAGDAIALLWEGGEHLVQRDLMEYGVTGLDRVVPSAANLLWQVASELAPRLDLQKLPLFHRRSTQPMTATVALSSPMAVVLQGELPKNLRDLTGLVGASFWIAQPAYSLLMGVPADQVKNVLSAMQLAFGPPQKHPITNMSASLRLAEKLWECIPSAAQRHLRELCLETLDYERARENAQWAQRRAGLYATGDLHWALTQLSQEDGQDLIAHVADPSVGENHPRVADLLRLATSAEYAAVRWQPTKGSESRLAVPQR